MKKALLILVAFALFASCKQDAKVDTTPKLPDTYISGQLENSLDKIRISGGDISETIAVNEDGTFSDTLQLREGYYRLVHGRKIAYLYIKPSDNIQISADMEDYPESLAFSGTGASNNNYIQQKRAKIADVVPPVKLLYSMEEAEFLSKINEIREASKEVISEADITPDFAAKEQQNIKYEYLERLKNYPSYHEYFAEKEDFKASADFTKPFESFDFDNDKHYKIYYPYKGLVNTHFMDIFDESKNTAGFVTALKAIKSEAIKNDMLQDVSYYVSPGAEKSDEIYEAVMSMSTDDELKEKLTEKHELLKSLVAGKPSPKFVYQDTKGNNIALEDLKGKHVYIDVWATWCGPCKREIPNLKELEKAHRDKNIEFVSVSVDQQKDIEKWKKMVDEKELTGVQVISDKDWKSDFVKDYAIEGIPRFILVNAEGNIVSADAPRPSEKEELLALFDEVGVK